MLVRTTFVIVIAAAAIVVAQRRADSFEENGSVWRFLPVTYCINSAGLPIGLDKQPLLSANQFYELVRQAFQKWEDDPNSSIRFTNAGFCDSVAGVRDRVNTVGWRNLGRLPAIGYAIRNESAGRYLRGGASYEKLEADIVLNSRVDIWEDLSYYLQTILPHTILHEVGHFIGLGHSEEKCTVMTEEERYPLELCQDDIDGVARLYP